MGELAIASRSGPVRIVDEPIYRFASADNVQRYRDEINLTPGEKRPASAYGVWVGDVPVIALGAGGGGTSVNPDTALIWNDILYAAIGDCVARLKLDPVRFAGYVFADGATCFGLHFSADHAALICHGELEITRLSADLQILWGRSGRDIFTGSFRLQKTYVLAHDWDSRPYRFDYRTGDEFGAVGSS